MILMDYCVDERPRRVSEAVVSVFLFSGQNGGQKSALKASLRSADLTFLMAQRRLHSSLTSMWTTILSITLSICISLDALSSGWQSGVT